MARKIIKKKKALKLLKQDKKTLAGANPNC
jgi:hypothetical protein